MKRLKSRYSCCMLHFSIVGGFRCTKRSCDLCAILKSTWEIMICHPHACHFMFSGVCFKSNRRDSWAHKLELSSPILCEAFCSWPWRFAELYSQNQGRKLHIHVYCSRWMKWLAWLLSQALSPDCCWWRGTSTPFMFLLLFTPQEFGSYSGPRDLLLLNFL